MNLAVLSAANSSHTVKIVNALAERGHTVVLYSLPQHKDVDHAISSKVNLVYLKETSYTKNHKQLAALLSEQQADVLYAHYATGYGTLARKAKFQPTVLAVWGSDVYDFPFKSPVHAWLLRKNLKFPKVIFSTSHAMAERTGQFTKTPIVETPFGVDISRFSSNKQEHGDLIRIGYLKIVAEIYGIEDLIRGFALLLEQTKNPNLELAIYGDGNLLSSMKELASGLNIQNQVVFHGRIPHKDAPMALNTMDILCVPSHRESFGVSAIEGMACGIPCVVSKADGLQEVTKDGETGLTVECKSPQSICNALGTLVNNPDLRCKMGLAGRERACGLYDWEKNITTIENALMDAAKQ